MDAQISHHLTYIFSTKQDTENSCLFELITVLKATQQVANVVLHSCRFSGEKLTTYFRLRHVGYLRTGIDNYVNLYAPDRIVLGGGIANGLKYLPHPLHTPGLLGPYKAYQTTIAVSDLAEQAGILGSAALFRPFTL